MCCAWLQVVGPKADAARIPGIDVQLGDGDTWKFGELQLNNSIRTAEATAQLLTGSIVVEFVLDSSCIVGAAH
jgi:hypothetical protein